MKKHVFALAGLALLVAGCVDTTGISPQSSKKPKGDPNATVTLTIYSDFQCPACRVAYSLLEKPLFAKYSSKVRLEIKQFPLMTLHPLALQMAEASECAADQGKFWEFADEAYTQQLEMDKQQQEASPSDITAWVQKIGLDMQLYGRCTASHIKRKTILAERDEGIKLQVGGTPTFFINGTMVPQDQLDLAKLSKLLDEALAADAGRKL